MLVLYSILLFRQDSVVDLMPMFVVYDSERFQDGCGVRRELLPACCSESGTEFKNGTMRKAMHVHKWSTLET